eukprot:5344477-Heterocapsa_arctica.AAC.1
MSSYIEPQEGYNADRMQCWDGNMEDLQKPMLFQVQHNRWCRTGNTARTRKQGITVDYIGVLKRTYKWAESTVKQRIG